MGKNSPTHQANRAGIVDNNSDSKRLLTYFAALFFPVPRRVQRSSNG
jgi:hypothetical protein